MKREESTQKTTITKSAAYASYRKDQSNYCNIYFITGENEREETTQNTPGISGKTAACASYKSNYVTYILIKEGPQTQI
jgi:hypothetical protein